MFARFDENPAMTVLTKYQIASSKAVVGVDRPIKVLSMHIQKSYKGIIV